MTLIATEPKISSNEIANSVTTNPTVIRRMISKLKKANLLKSKAGVTGFSLTRKPKDITLLDIFKAVNLEMQLFSIHSSPNPNCPIGKKIQETLNNTFDSVQSALEQDLNNRTLQDIMENLFE